MCIVIFWIKKLAHTKQVFGDPRRTADFRHAKLCVCQLCDSKDDDARWLSLAKPSLEAAFSSRHKCFTISPQHRRDFSFPLVVWSNFDSVNFLWSFICRHIDWEILIYNNLENYIFKFQKRFNYTLIKTQPYF